MERTVAQTHTIGTFKDPASAWTHFLGFIAAVFAVAGLLIAALPDTAKAVAMAIYGAATIGIFLASSTYHFFDLGEAGNRWLKRLDHSAIFLMIAGSYVPPVMHFLDGAWRIAMLSIIGAIALAGVALKLLWIDCPRWLGTGIYLAMGWLVVVPAHLILPQLEPSMLAWLVGGGLAYSVGALVYVFEWPDPWPEVFGHHEVWHLFVLAGAACHFVFMMQLLDVPVPPFG